MSLLERAFPLKFCNILATPLGIGGYTPMPLLPAATQSGGNMPVKMRAVFACFLSCADCINRPPALSITLPGYPLLLLNADASIPFISPMKRAQKYFSSSAKGGRIFILGPEYPMCGSCWGVSCGFARWPPFEYSLKPWRRAVQVSTVKNGADSPCGIRPEPQMGTKKLRRAYPKGCENAVFYLPARLTALKAY